MNELDSLIILNAIPGIGNVSIKRIIEYFGSASKVLEQSSYDLKATQFLTNKIVESIQQFAKDDFITQENSLIKGNNVQVLTYLDSDYPTELLEIPDFPVLLYTKGRRTFLNELSIAIVGSRRSSLYGKIMAEQFASRFAEYNICTVSGMARGIDTAAHRGSLKASGATIAVLGSGLANIYPKDNERLFHEISEKGVVLSEFPMQAPPAPYHFPRRNRIISGLSLGVLVAEAAQKSGALITADFALEQGREVYTIPGKIDNPMAFGSNQLIKQGAKLVTSIEDIIEDLAPQILNPISTRNVFLEAPEESTKKSLSQKESIVYQHINDRPIHIDELIERSNIPQDITAVMLLQLELKHLVKQLPGKLYIR